MRYCEAGPYANSGSRVLMIGGGITTTHLLHALKDLYMVGVRVHKSFNEERFTAGEGPARLVVCNPYHFSASGGGSKPNSAEIPTIGAFLEHLKKTRQSLATFETTLHYLLSDTLIVLRQQVLLSLIESVENDQVELVVAKNGGDGPVVIIHKYFKSEVFPDKMLFFTERALHMEWNGNPFSPRS